MRPPLLRSWLVVLALLAPPGFARPVSVDSSLSGEVVDLACYVGHAAKGPDHQKCALKCAQMGQPMGLLTSEGKIYLLVADHAEPDAYNKARSLAGVQVEIRGEPMDRDGLTILTVHDVKKK